LQDAAARAEEDGLSLSCAVCDALDGDSVRRAVDAASDGDGRLHIAVVVPGGGTITPVLLFGDDQFSAEVDKNVRPVYLLLKYAGQAMVRASGGSFVAISSTAAVFSTRYLASYSAGKAAVDQLVRVAADELGRLNVRVNAVRPGLTLTPTTEAAFKSEPMLQAFLAGQPIERSGQVSDIAGAVRFLAGPESSWITGQLLTVDGGHTLRAFVDYAELLDLPDQGDVARRAERS
jgi:NAD(P)-dependent dehydrogenase (short-subunit alcohol dehydrogenase family)